MNIYEYIKNDHQKVADLFKQFHHTSSNTEKKEIISTIGQELLVHLESEENTFYKTLRERAPSKTAALHGSQEHQEIEEQLNIVLNVTEMNHEWNKEVLTLQRIVEHHVSEEEGVLHNIAKEVLTVKEAVELKDKMHHFKQKMLTKIKKTKTA